MSKPVLTYWAGRGRAENIRLMMAAGGIEFEHGPYLRKPEDIEKLRSGGKLAFNQVPLLEIDGLNLVQATATSRYVAGKGGLIPTDPKLAALNDVYVEGCRDFLAPFMTKSFMPDDMFVQSVRTIAEKYMPYFEKILAAQPGPNLVGSKLSMSDVSLFEVLLQVDEFYSEVFDKFPKQKAFYAHTKSLPNLAKYLAGPQRFPPADAAYVNSVKLVLGM